MVGPFAAYPALADRVVGVQRQERPEVAFPGIHAVGGEQDQPVRGAALAVAAVGQPAGDAPYALRRGGRAENPGGGGVLGGPLTGASLGVGGRQPPLGAAGFWGGEASGRR